MNDFEILCERGLEAAENIDKGRWTIGDLALQVKKIYGRDTVGKFATRINVPKLRVSEYRSMSDFYPESMRKRIFEQYPPGLITYTHLRTARRLKDPVAVIAFIDECASNAWTCEVADVTLTKRLKPETVIPKKLLDGLGFIRDIRGQRVLIEVDVAILPAMHEAWRGKKPVHVTVTLTEDRPDINPVIALLGSGYTRQIDTRLVIKEAV